MLGVCALPQVSETLLNTISGIRRITILRSTRNQNCERGKRGFTGQCTGFCSLEPFFYRVYNEPFSSKADRPQGVPREYLREFDAARDDVSNSDWDIPYLPPEGAQHLQQFTVYNTTTTDEEEQRVFGRFAEWFVEDGKNLAEDNQCHPKWHLDSSQVSAVWEVMSMLVAFWHFTDLVPQIADGDGQLGHGGSNPDDESLPRRQVGPTREVTVIIFGIFAIEDISMPAVVDDHDASTLELIANPAKVYQQSENAVLDNQGTLINVDIRSIHSCIYCDSGFPNHNDDHQMAPPDFKLVKFFEGAFRLAIWNFDI